MIKQYTFANPLWIFPGKTPWHFITVPKEIGAEIDYYFTHVKHAWGSVYVRATIEDFTWDTSVFPDKKVESFQMPIRKEIREKLNLKAGQQLTCTLFITDERKMVVKPHSK